MNCYDCVQIEVERPAVAAHRSRSARLCRGHLVELHRSSMKPLYS